MSHLRRLIGSALFLALVGTAGSAWACPFCSAVSLTFCEEIKNSDVAVIAELVELPSRPPAGEDTLAPAGKAKFVIQEVLKGKKELGETRRFETLFFGENPVGSTFLVMGIEPPLINWSTPIAIGKRGRDYIAKAQKLPKEGADRLAFFQDFLEDADELLARDAYDEFAKTPYAGVKELKDRLNHDKIVGWVKDPKVTASRRRLYLTMLGVCGNDKDAELLKSMIESKDRQAKAALDALIASYLTLKGPAGVALIEDLFIKDTKAEYTDTYAAIMALRFHGQEEMVIPRERLLEAIRHMLDRPQLADLVIPDLSRWEDWESMDRLVALFKNADDESSWVRVPVINYLRACPLPQAKQHIDELAKIDPDVVKRANSFFPFGAASKPAEKLTAEKAPTEKSPEQAKGDASKTEGPEQKSDPADPASKSSAAPGVKQLGKPARVKTSSSAKPERGELTAGPIGGAGLPLSAKAALLPREVNRAWVLSGLGFGGVLLALAFFGILRGGQRSTP